MTDNVNPSLPRCHYSLSSPTPPLYSNGPLKDAKETVTLNHCRCFVPGVMSHFVINVPTRDLLVPYTKRSFQIMVGALALQLQCL